MFRQLDSPNKPYADPRWAYYKLIIGRLLHLAYLTVPEMRVVNLAKVPEQGLVRRKLMYELVEEPVLLEFLIAPEKPAICLTGFILAEIF